MRDDLMEIIRRAKELGFPQVQIATNGIKLGKDIDYVEGLKNAGLSTVYLHFDGVTKETNFKLKMDEKAVENCEKVGLGVVLVPPIIRGRNDHEAGAIIQFAADHIRTVRGVNFQPIAFTGAASEEDVQRERITIPELLDDIEQQTGGVIRASNWPHPSFKKNFPDEGKLLDTLGEWTQSEAERRRILVTNPARLYGFA